MRQKKNCINILGRCSMHAREKQKKYLDDGPPESIREQPSDVRRIRAGRSLESIDHFLGFALNLSPSRDEGVCIKDQRIVKSSNRNWHLRIRTSILGMQKKKKRRIS